MLLASASAERFDVDTSLQRKQVPSDIMFD